MRYHERMLSPKIPAENDDMYPNIPIVMTAEAAADILCIGRATMFQIIREGKIKTFLLHISLDGIDGHNGLVIVEKGIVIGRQRRPNLLNFFESSRTSGMVKRFHISFWN